MHHKSRYLSLLILVVFPVILFAQDTGYINYSNMTPAAKQAVCYGAVEKNPEIIKEGVTIVREAAKLDLVNPINYYTRKQVLLLNQLFTTHNNLTMSDYYKIGCENIERPADL